MPEPNRIGVIHPSADVHDAWFEASGLARNAVWQIVSMVDTEAMQRNRWMLWSVLCLPGWEQIPDAQAIRTAAETLVVPLPRRGREGVPVMSVPDREAVIVPSSAPGNAVVSSNLTQRIIDAPVTREACIEYLTRHFPHAFAPRAMDMAPTPDLIMLRGLSIRVEAARLNSRTSDERSYRDQITTLIQRLNERSRAPAGELYEGLASATTPPRAVTRTRTTVSAPTRPPPVADVLADAMREARESIAQGNDVRRAQQILDRVREVSARRRPRNSPDE